MKVILALLLILNPLIASAQWTYRTTNDQMREIKTKFAELNSSNRAQLGFPYQGGSVLQLIIRKRSNEQISDVEFWINSGQIPCRAECNIVTKFDDDEVKEWAATGSESGRNNLLFVDDATDFIERLKNAKKLIVEVQIYDYGRFQYSYNPKNLKWD